MFNIYAPQDLTKNQLKELSISTDSAGSVAFQTTPAGLQINGGLPYVVPGLTNKYVPMFANELAIDWTAGSGNPRLSVAVAPYSPYYYAGLTTPVDNIKKLTVAFRIYCKSSAWTGGSYYFIGTPYYFNTNYPNWLIRPISASSRTFGIYFRNAQDTATKGPYYITGAAGHINIDEWTDIYFTYEYNVVARAGMIKVYTNDVKRYEYVLGDDAEIGYWHNTYLTKDFSVCGSVSADLGVYDLYICNEHLWTATEIAQFRAHQTIDQSKYSVYWSMKKDDDRPYLIDVCPKSGAVINVPGPNPNLEWIPESTTPVDLETQYAVPVMASAAGEYTITATKTNADGSTATDQIIVTVNDSALKDYNRMQSVVLANHAGLAPVADMTIVFRTLVTSLPTTSTKMIDCGVGADDLFASWQVSLNPAGTLTLGGISGSTYVSVTSTLTIPAGSETAIIIKKNGTSINLSIGDNSENLTLASDWDCWSSSATVRIGDVGFSGAVWDLYTFTRLINSAEVTKYKAGYRVSNYAYHNSLQIKDGKISNGYLSGFIDIQ